MNQKTCIIIISQGPAGEKQSFAGAQDENQNISIKYSHVRIIDLHMYVASTSLTL